MGVLDIIAACALLLAMIRAKTFKLRACYDFRTGPTRVQTSEPLISRPEASSASAAPADRLAPICSDFVTSDMENCQNYVRWRQTAS